jgi:endo-1,4-beta-xylanase
VDAGKWLSVESQLDTMVWTILDSIFGHAANTGMPVKQHTFVWGQQEPRWIGGLPPDEQRAEVEEWMRLFSERYPDVAFIDVVNEPLHAPPSYADALGGAGETGWDWVVWSFERARELFPNAKLLINEYNILCCASERERYLEIVGILQERGLIDGIGLQAHGLEQVDTAVIEMNLDAVAQTGLPIYISELELEASDDQVQLERYQRVFPVLWEHEAVAGMTLWGYKAGQIWKDSAYLFPSRQKDQITTRSVRNVVKRAAIEADVQPYKYENGDFGRGDPEDVHPHVLRHSLAYRLLHERDEDRFDIYFVRNRLRHASLQTTLREYDHFRTI